MILFHVWLDYVIFLMQLEGEDKEVKDQVTETSLLYYKQIYLYFFGNIIGISWSEFKFIFLVSGGRGYGGPMQPGVFHGYPLKSPKMQGVTCIYTATTMKLNSSVDDHSDNVNLCVMLQFFFCSIQTVLFALINGQFYVYHPKFIYGGFITSQF